MQALRRKIKYTYEDYLQTPEDKRYELIDGDLYMTPSPLTKHQRVILKIYDQLRGSIKGKDLGEIFVAPLDVVLSNFDVFEPDLFFISKKRISILTERNVQGAPDLVIEVLSPGTKDRDLGIKKTAYERYGVLEYWIVDPELEQIEVLKLEDEGLRTFRVFPKGTHLQSPLLPQLNFLVDEVF